MALLILTKNSIVSKTVVELHFDSRHFAGHASYINFDTPLLAVFFIKTRRVKPLCKRRWQANHNRFCDCFTRSKKVGKYENINMWRSKRRVKSCDIYELKYMRSFNPAAIKCRLAKPTPLTVLISPLTCFPLHLFFNFQRAILQLSYTIYDTYDSTLNSQIYTGLFIFQIHWDIFKQIIQNSQHETTLRGKK